MLRKNEINYDIQIMVKTCIDGKWYHGLSDLDPCESYASIDEAKYNLETELMKDGIIEGDNRWYLKNENWRIDNEKPEIIVLPDEKHDVAKNNVEYYNLISRIDNDENN